MGEFKQINPISIFSAGFETLYERGKDIMADIKDVLDNKVVENTSLSISAIKVLIASDPILASCQFALKQQRMMFPL